ncbi:DUF4192 domain-containing protein [Pseudactinotalea sp. Z1732]|uniref:DUF4192 domain-containing protein n=1 Tax=Pseudactinotalea sp. Z1732 TaxID=3413026 RepID=UPI003C7A7182
MDTANNTPVVLRLDDPVELLAYLPYRLGFWPEESAVFFAVRSAAHEPDPEVRWRPGLVARVDLVDLADPAPDGGARLRRDMLGHLRADGAEIVFMVLYTGAAPAHAEAGDRWPTGPAGTVTRWWLREGSGADPSRVWLVSGERYRCLECDAQPCCPPGGHPLARIRQSRIGAEMVFGGMTYAPSRADLLRHVEVGAALRASAVRAAARWRRKQVRAGGSRMAWLSTLAARWDQALVSTGPLDRATGADLGALLVGLEEPLVRDAVLLSVASGAPVLQVLHDDGEALLAQVFSPGGEPPERDLAARATDVLHHLVAVAARGRTAQVWAVLAWLAWYEGNGARADLCLHQCLEQDPQHRLASLIRRAVDHGIPPGWARARSVA